MSSLGKEGAVWIQGKKPWAKLPHVTLTPRSSSLSSTSESSFALLTYEESKTSLETGSGKKTTTTTTTTTELAIVNTHMTITEAPAAAKTGWLKLPFTSSSSSQPQAYFAVDALPAPALRKALQYNLTPARPENVLLGFASLDEAKAWHALLLASSSSNSASKRKEEEEAKDKVMPITIPTAASKALPTPSRPFSSSSSAARHQALEERPVAAQTTPNLLTAASRPFSSSSSAARHKSLEERLQDLHTAEQQHRLNELRGLTPGTTDVSGLQERHKVLNGGGGGGEGGVHVVATEGLTEEEMVR